MKNPRIKIALELSRAVFLAAVIMIGIWFAPGDYHHDLAALVNKRDLLVSKTPPRVAFIGGSNLATLDSVKIERGIRSAGGMNYSVVNLGLWAGLSIERYINEIEPYLGQGDIVIICQEYAALLDKSFFNYIKSNDEANMFFFLMSPKKQLLRYATDLDLLESTRLFVRLNQLKIKTYLHAAIDGNLAHRFTGGFYRYEDDYNAHGDRNFPFRITRPLNGSGARFGEPGVEDLRYLMEFSNRARRKKIRALFLFPPFPANEYLLNKKQIDSLAHLIYEIYRLETLAGPKETIFPESCFADTVNHLRPECERSRTAMVIKKLRSRILP